MLWMASLSFSSFCCPSVLLFVNRQKHRSVNLLLLILTIMINLKFRLDLFSKMRCGGLERTSLFCRLGDIARELERIGGRNGFIWFANSRRRSAISPKTFRDVAEELHYFEGGKAMSFKVKIQLLRGESGGGDLRNWENVFANSRKRSAISRNYSANSPEDGSISPNRFAISQNGGGRRVPSVAASSHV